MDKLKEHINKNKDLFDLETPPKWQEERFVPAKKVRMVPIYYLYASAAVFVGIIASFGIYMLLNNWEEKKLSKENEKTQMEGTEIELSSLSKERAEIESHYNKLFEERIKQIDSLGLKSEIEDELQVLEQDFEALKAEIKFNTESEDLVQKLIENYKLKIELLEWVITQSKANNTDNQITLNNEEYTIYN